MRVTLFKDEITGLYSIHSRDQLRLLMKELGLRWDWHEPDNQGVEAVVFGDRFDNAGFWGRRFRLGQEQEVFSFTIQEEMNVLLVKDDKPVAEINLATLFSWACAFDD